MNCVDTPKYYCAGCGRELFGGDGYYCQMCEWLQKQGKKAQEDHDGQET